MITLWEKPWDVRIHYVTRNRKKWYQWLACRSYEGVYSVVIDYMGFQDKKDCQKSWREYSQQLRITKYNYIYDHEKVKIERLMLNVPRARIRDAKAA